MLFVDQAKRGDARLTLLAGGFLAGFAILLAGLWYIQIVSSQKYAASQKEQSFRVLRVPGARGRILDRHGQVLADNQPRFNVNLYLEDIRHLFTYEYTNAVKKEFVDKHKRNPKNGEEIAELSRIARYRAVSNIVWQVSSSLLPQPLILNPWAFERHYNERRALPMPVVSGMDQEQVAMFLEKNFDVPGILLEIEPVRYYPHGSLAAHALGYVQKESEEMVEDDFDFNVRLSLPSFKGVAGLENGFNSDLNGKPGAKAILVNNVGYRENEETWVEPAPGKNVVLTLDLEIQKAAERALASSGPDTRGAAVVLDVRNGDILAMVSAPAYDLNMFVQREKFTTNDWNRLQDEVLTPQYNRALQGAYQPGSTFKIVVALAAFEAGVMDLETSVYNPGYYELGRRKIRDRNAPAGESWAFKDAFKLSANTYFIDVGLKAGKDRLLDMGARFNLGEKTGVVQPGLEKSGYYPKVGVSRKTDGSPWTDGDTANLCIGQGEITVTPLQMALVTAAVANGGNLLRPRLVMQVEEQTPHGSVEPMPPGQIERNINVNPKHLEWIKMAMLADVEDSNGTGRGARIPEMKISGKTGTAQVRNAKGQTLVVWFVSFAPYDNPKYAVVVVMETENYGSGGLLCAPKAKVIYSAIQQQEQKRLKRVAAME
jgi:penicillin-binding protein 2